MSRHLLELDAQEHEDFKAFMLYTLLQGDPSTPMTDRLRSKMAEFVNSVGVEESTHRVEVSVTWDQDMGSDWSPEAVLRNSAHFAHCNHGDFIGKCKYGDVDCPALSPSMPF